MRTSAAHFAKEYEYYSPEVQAALEGRLRTRLAHLEYHLLEGKHRFPSRATWIVDAWQQRHFAR